MGWADTVGHFVEAEVVDINTRHATVDVNHHAEGLDLPRDQISQDLQEWRGGAGFSPAEVAYPGGQSLGQVTKVLPDAACHHPRHAKGTEQEEGHEAQPAHVFKEALAVERPEGEEGKPGAAIEQGTVGRASLQQAGAAFRYSLLNHLEGLGNLAGVGGVGFFVEPAVGWDVVVVAIHEASLGGQGRAGQPAPPATQASRPPEQHPPEGGAVATPQSKRQMLVRESVNLDDDPGR